MKISVWKVFLFVYFVAAGVLLTAVVSARYFPATSASARPSPPHSSPVLRRVEKTFESFFINSPGAQLFLGRIYQKKNDRAEAKSHFENAVRLAPQSGDAHYRLGNAHLEWGEYDEAAKELKEAIRVEPTHTKAMERLAALYRNTGREAEAVELYQSVLAVMTRQQVTQGFEAAAVDLPKEKVEPPAPPPAFAAKDKIVLKSGRTMEGRITRRDDTGIWIEMAPGAEVFIAVEQVAEVRPSA